MVELSPKIERFCQEYMIDLNGAQACIRAGYSARSAKEQASALLTKPNVKERIAELKAEIATRLSINQDWVLDRFKNISDRCMTAIPVMEFDPVQKKMVQRTETTEENKEVGVWQFDSSGANKATEMIGKHLGFFEADHSMTLKIGKDLADEFTD